MLEHLHPLVLMGLALAALVVAMVIDSVLDAVRSFDDSLYEWDELEDAE